MSFFNSIILLYYIQWKNCPTIWCFKIVRFKKRNKMVWLFNPCSGLKAADDSLILRHGNSSSSSSSSSSRESYYFSSRSQCSTPSPSSLRRRLIPQFMLSSFLPILLLMSVQSARCTRQLQQQLGTWVKLESEYIRSPYLEFFLHF